MSLSSSPSDAVVSGAKLHKNSDTPGPTPSNNRPGEVPLNPTPKTRLESRLATGTKSPKPPRGKARTGATGGLLTAAPAAWWDRTPGAAGARVRRGRV